MNPLALIEKYYTPGSTRHRLLVDHSRHVAAYAEDVARRQAAIGAGVDVAFVREAAWLHDIGIYLTASPKLDCHGKAPYLLHGILGARLLLKEGLPRHARVCERHIGVGLGIEDIRSQGLPLPERDMHPQTLEEQIVAYADLFFSKHAERPSTVKPAEQVRSKLARYGAAKVAIFDGWHARFTG